MQVMINASNASTNTAACVSLLPIHDVQEPVKQSNPKAHSVTHINRPSSKNSGPIISLMLEYNPRKGLRQPLHRLLKPQGFRRFRHKKARGFPRCGGGYI